MVISRWLRLFVALFLFVIAPAASEARHIIGGEMTYECLGVDTFNNTVRYRFTLKVYRDCYGGGANFDSPAEIGIFEQLMDGTYRHIRTPGRAPIAITLSSINRLDPNEANPCVIVPPSVCVEEGIYIFEYILPIIDGNYVISYQRCCRNNTIFNIVEPWDAGAAYTVEISPEAQRSCNNSPVFNNFPPIVICVNEQLIFDHSASDAEGDQLVYEFCAPLIGGGPLGTATNPGNSRSCNGVIPNPINCPPPYSTVRFVLPNYSAVNPLGGSPSVTIDPNTGLITGVPDMMGQFVVGVCVKEYRNGRLIGSLRRDFQFNVTTCTQTVYAELASDSIAGGQEFVINSCGNNTVEFKNLSYDTRFIQNYKWTFDINGQVQEFNERDISVTFPGLGSYTGTMVLNEGLPCSDTAFINVNVYPEINADFEFEYDTCVAGPVIFADLSKTGAGQITGWSWSFEGGGSARTADPLHRFQTPGNKDVLLQVRDANNCIDTALKRINWFPVPPLLIIEPSASVGCAPSEITFLNLSSPIDETYDIIWDFGDGGGSDEISPTHTFESPGIYSIKIEVTSPIGCYTEAFFPDRIRVEESPIADFSYTPDQPDGFNPTVRFQDESIDASAWQWVINDSEVLFDRNPIYTFRDTGLYKVELIVFHPSGCPDTAVQYIDIIPRVTFFLPNAFTPNGDGKNDVYIGNGVLEGVRSFEMSIWNRWGEMVFQTNDPTEGWNGRVNNSGTLSPNGVYPVVVQYIGPRGEPVTIKGFATVIR